MLPAFSRGKTISGKTIQKQTQKDEKTFVAGGEILLST
jgi:hypothetical protein